MEKKFMEPQIEVVELSSMEVITASGCDDHYCLECTDCYSQFKA